MSHGTAWTGPAADAVTTPAPVTSTTAVIDLRDVDLRQSSAATAEISDALAISLADGDLAGAERLLGFLGQLQSDRGLLLSDIVEPILVDGMASADASPLFFRTARELLRGQERHHIHVAHEVALWAPDMDATALRMHVVALLLNDVSASAVVINETYDGALVNAVTGSATRVVCMPARRAGQSPELLSALRAQQLRVVLAADSATDLGAPPPGVAACAATAGQLSELLKVLRGPLTVAEATALKLAADGCTNVRIAHELGISVSGVKARLESSFVKLRAADRTHAVALALRNGWIS